MRIYKIQMQHMSTNLQYENGRKLYQKGAIIQPSNCEVWFFQFLYELTTTSTVVASLSEQRSWVKYNQQCFIQQSISPNSPPVIRIIIKVVKNFQRLFLYPHTSNSSSFPSFTTIIQSWTSGPSPLPILRLKNESGNLFFLEDCFLT